MIPPLTDEETDIQRDLTVPFIHPQTFTGLLQYARF